MKITQTPSFTRSPSRCGGKCARGSFSHSRIWSRFGLASAAKVSESNISARGSAPRATTTAEPPTSARVRAVRAGVENGRPPDLGALADLDRGAEGDDAVAAEVDGERACGRAGRGVLGDADATARTSASSSACPSRRSSCAEAVMGVERGEVGLERGDGRPRPGAGRRCGAGRSRSPRPGAASLDAERREQFAGPLVRLFGKGGCSIQPNTTCRRSARAGVARPRSRSRA